jgi:hypothetical protein
MCDAPSLIDSIQELYEVFERYPLRDHIAVCDHCHLLEDVALLKSKELRRLGVDELQGYMFAAMTTWGDDQDFRHYLPRILELLACDRRLTDEFMDPSMALENLQYAQWASWPAEEQKAVKRYLLALWDAKVNEAFPLEDCGPSFIEDWLCAIGNVENDLAPYLNIWVAAVSSNAVRNLSHFTVTVAEELAEKKLQDAFWSQRQTQSTQVVEWLLGPEVRAKLTTASIHNLSADKWVVLAIRTLKKLS